jgi:hypothetical protein
MMPGKRPKGLVSKAQTRYMFAKHPKIAKKLAAETPKSRWKRMPAKKKK